MVLLEGHLVGLGGVDADEVWVVLVPLAVADALEEDLDEAQASAAGKERVRQGLARSRRPRPPTTRRSGWTLNTALPVTPEYQSRQSLSCHVYTCFRVT